MGFIPNAQTGDTYTLTVGSGGTAQTADWDDEYHKGGTGGTTSLSGHGVNFRGFGGEGGQAGPGNSDPSAGQGGGAAGGVLNWQGGRGGNAIGDSGDWTACGGGAVQLHPDAHYWGYNKSDKGQNNGGQSIPNGLPNTEVSGVIMRGYSSFTGGRGTFSINDDESAYGLAGDVACGGGGGAKSFWNGAQNGVGKGGPGGDGLVIVVYYGQGNLK